MNDNQFDPRMRDIRDRQYENRLRDYVAEAGDILRIAVISAFAILAVFATLIAIARLYL